MLTPAILTGSKVFGIPRPDSDTDLMIYMREDDAKKLASLEPASVCNSESEGYGTSVERLVFRFGNLNLTVCCNLDQYEAWAAAHAEAVARSPLSKQECGEIFVATRQKLGVM